MAKVEIEVDIDDINDSVETGEIDDMIANALLREFAKIKGAAVKSQLIADLVTPVEALEVGDKTEAIAARDALIELNDKVLVKLRDLALEYDLDVRLGAGQYLGRAWGNSGLQWMSSSDDC